MLKTHILSLHEEIFRNIFCFLSEEEVYFTVRRVCRQLKCYVENYIELAGNFFLSYGPGSSTKILCVFKRNGAIVSICYRTSRIIVPHPNIGLNYNNISSKFYFGGGSFGVAIQGKLVVGINYWEDDKNLEAYSQYSYHYDKAKSYLVEYEEGSNTWLEVEKYNFHNTPENFHFQVTRPFENNFLTTCLADTILGTAILILRSEHNVGSSIIFHDLNPRKQCHNVNKRSGYKPLSGINGCTIFDPSNPLTNEAPIWFQQDLEVKDITECAIVHSTFNEVMLVGGKFGRSKLNPKLWKMKLQKCHRKDGSTHYQWAANPISLVKTRIRPICFKLGNNIYIAGGQTLNESDECTCVEGDYYQELDKDGIMKCFSRYCKSNNKWKSLLCCDKYDILADEYYESCYFLPWCINDVDKIATDSNETFAIITRRNKGQCLIFTEEKGFHEISNSDVGENPKHPWGYYEELRSDQRIFFCIQ